MCAAAIGALALAPTPCVAQTAGVTSRTDAYGNARPYFGERRDIGLYQNDIQRRALSGVQSIGRRANRRGGLTPFSLIGDAALPVGRRPDLPSPYARYSSLGYAMPSPLAGTARVSPNLQLAFRGYGGFGDRQQSGPGGILMNALQRPRMLTFATGLNAPVQRAMWNRGLIVTATSTVDWDPFGPSEPPQAEETDRPLSPSLGTRVADAQQEAVRNAWSAFSEGDFRRAVRYFDTASILEPGDHASRIGMVLSHLGLSAMRTSVVHLASLARRDPNPFRHDLELPERLKEVELRRELHLRAELFAQANTEDAAAHALNMLLLWHLQDASGARIAATALRSVDKESLYSHWPKLVDEAIRMQQAGPSAGADERPRPGDGGESNAGELSDWP